MSGSANARVSSSSQQNELESPMLLINLRSLLSRFLLLLFVTLITYVCVSRRSRFCWRWPSSPRSLLSSDLTAEFKPETSRTEGLVRREVSRSSDLVRIKPLL